MQPTRRWYFQVRCYEGGSSTFRRLAAATMSELVDKAARLYHNTWKKWPDMIEVKRTKDYTFN